MTDHLPPHDNESERACLGCLLIDPQRAIPQFIECCPMSAELFYDLRHQRILNAITDLHNKGSGVDLVTLQSLLRESGNLEQVGGIDYLSRLQDATPSAANLPFYLTELRDKFIRRKIIQTGMECAQAAYGHAGSSDELLDTVERQVLAIRGIQPKPKDGIKDLVRKAVGEMELAYGRQGAIGGIPIFI